jgi:HEAT repeat protein
VEDHENDLRAISLSGISDSAEHLVSLLGQHDEGDRAELVTALALLGSADTAATLMQRYLTEDEDVRWATLKALDYIGGGESAEFIEQHGTKDENKACQALAERITH